MFTDTTMNVVGSLGTISTDIFGAVGCLVLLIALGLAKGKNSLFLFLIALYPASLVVIFFPFYEQIQISSVPSIFVPLTVLILSAGLVCFVLKRYVNAGYQYNKLWRFIEVTALSVCITGLGIAILYHVVDFDTYYSFSGFFNTLFASSLALFIWIVAPLAGIPLFLKS